MKEFSGNWDKCRRNKSQAKQHGVSELEEQEARKEIGNIILIKWVQKKKKIEADRQLQIFSAGAREMLLSNTGRRMAMRRTMRMTMRMEERAGESALSVTITSSQQTIHQPSNKQLIRVKWGDTGMRCLGFIAPTLCVYVCVCACVVWRGLIGPTWYWTIRSYI